jgi:hypothetical protein
VREPAQPLHDGRELVQERQLHRGHDQRADEHAGDAAHAAQHDHGQDGDGDLELEGVGRDGLQAAGVDHAGNAGEERAHGKGQQLGLGQVDAHTRGGQLVLTHGHPGPAQARILQPARQHDDGDQSGEAQVIPR